MTRTSRYRVHHHHILHIGGSCLCYIRELLAAITNARTLWIRYPIGLGIMLSDSAPTTDKTQLRENFFNFQFKILKFSQFGAD